MRAAVLVRNGEFELQDREPPRPGPDCLVRVHSAGVCSSDLPRAFAHGAYHAPIVLGHEFAGVVEHPGETRDAPAAGTPVTVFPLIPCRRCEACFQGRWAHCIRYDYFGSRRDGGFQELVAVPPWNLLPLPGGLLPDLGCLAEPVAVAHHAARQAPEPGPGATALVLGAGLIGVCVARLLGEAGYVTEVSDRNPEKLVLAAECGVAGFPAQDLRGMENRCSLVVEASGAPENFARSIRLAGPLGTVVWIGNITGDLAVPKDDVSRILRKELSIHGVWNSEYRRGMNDDWSAALLFLARHASWVRHLVTHRVRLEELPAELGRLHEAREADRSRGFVKVVVDLG